MLVVPGQSEGSKTAASHWLLELVAGRHSLADSAAHLHCLKLHGHGALSPLRDDHMVDGTGFDRDRNISTSPTRRILSSGLAGLSP